MSIITLTSDYGLKDGAVASVKARLLQEINKVTLVDISHDVSPYNVPETAFIVKNVFREFPKKTIHLIGVDAEQTEQRKHLLVVLEQHFFIGADNGFFSLLQPDLKFEHIYQIVHPKSDTSIFPMKEVFSEIATSIINDDFQQFVNPINSVTIWKSNYYNTTAENELLAHIVYVDRMGNLITDLTKQDFEQFVQNKYFEIYISRKKITKIFQKYDDFMSTSTTINNLAGKAIAVFNSFGLLEIALYKSSPEHGGSAAELLGLKVGDSVRIVKS